MGLVVLVFTRQKLAFLAIPKTGTTAIHAALAPHAGVVFAANPYKHMDFSEFNRVVCPFLGGTYETVCIVREPRERLQSWFRYLKQRGAASSFPEMVESVLSGVRIDPAYGRQLDFVRDGDRQVTTLIRYGDPGIEDFFANRLDRFVQIFRRNVSARAEIETLRPDLEDALAMYLEPDTSLYESIPPLREPRFERPNMARLAMRRAVWAIERAEAKAFRD